MSSTRKILSIAVLLPLGASILSMGAPAMAASAPIPESFTYNGAGWGHGVGMSQYGAYGMALEGFSAEKILEHYYNPAKLDSSNAYASSDIKVQLIGGIGSSVITPKNGELRVKFDNKTIQSSQPVKFEVNGNKVKIKINDKAYDTDGSSGVSVEWQNTRHWKANSGNTTVSIPSTNGGVGTGEYRHGKISVNLLGKKLNIVNSLRLNDEYLYGLAEVPSSWPSATLQAQAIAGRTYAQKNMSSLKSACECNVYDETQSQKFTGWGKENEANGYIGAKWVAAVNATQTKQNGTPITAKVMKHNGKLIDAVYSSSTGGKTRAAKDVWGGDLPYLQSRDDRWALKPETGNSNRAWSSTISQAKAASGYGLPDVKRVTIKRAGDQTILSSTAFSSTGKVSTLDGTKTRSLFGAKSKWVVGITAQGDFLPSTDNTPITNTPANVKYETKANLNLRSGASTAYDVVKVLANGTEVITTGKKSGDWLQVKSGTSTGWVSSNFLVVPKPKPVPPKPTSPKPAPPKPIPKPPVVQSVSYSNTVDLNVRASANVLSKKLGLLKKNSSVEVLGISNGWAKIKHGKSTAYVSSIYLTKKSSNPKPPVANVVNTIDYVTTAKLNVRKSANATSSLLGKFDKGNSVKVYNISNGWAKVKFKTTTAYVSSSYIKKKEKNSPVKVSTVDKKVTANLNMRAGASTGHSILTTIPNGKTIKATGKKSGSWVEVIYGGKTGWVSGSYVK